MHPLGDTGGEGAGSPLLDLVARVREPALPAVVVAHRGDSQNAPENTLAAFALALRHGAEMVELDVHQSASGDVVVLHDDRVDRTTDGHGEVARLRTEELRELSAGGWFAPQFQGERVPLLDEVLDLCRGRAVPMIEIKVKRRRSPDAGARVAEALARHGMQERAAVICRELERVREVRAASPATPICYLTYTKRQARAATRLAGVTGVDCYWKSLSLSLVSELRAASFLLTPWTVNRAQDMERLLLLGCDAIISDAPVLLRDRIEAFEFQRTAALRERFLRGDDVDLDLETADDDGAAPDAVSDLLASDSEVDIEVDWPEDPPD